MRIAAGIILIIAAIGNIFGGAGYVLGGALTAGAGMVMDEVAKEAKVAGTEGAISEEEAKKAQEALTEVGLTSGSGTFWMVFGLFLWILFILQIVGAIMLFLSKAKMFIFIVCALSVIAEVIGLINVGFVFWQLFGLVGGVLGFIGAGGIGKVEAAPPAAPAEG